MPDVPSREEFDALVEKVDGLTAILSNMPPIPEIPPMPDHPGLIKVFDSATGSMSEHTNGGGTITKSGENSWIFRSHFGRAEFQDIHTAKIGDGKRWLYRWKMYSPPKIFSVPDWMIHGQFHRGYKHPPFSIQGETDSYTPTILKPIRNDGRDRIMEKVPYQAIQFPAEFAVEAVWDKKNGEYTLWINDELITSYSGDTVIEGDKIYPKFGIYDGGPGDVEVEIGNIEVYEVLQ